jgi:excisionase family DNA binding protein
VSRSPEFPLTKSVEEAGRVLGISRKSAYRAVATGEIPSVRIGKRIVVPTHLLLELLNPPAGAGARQEQAPPPPLSSERAQRFALALGRATRKAGP